MSISAYIKEIGRGTKGARSLSREQATDLMGQLLDGQLSDLETGAFCVAMRFKGESAQELAGFLDATQARLPVWPQATDGRPVVVLPSYNGSRKLPNLIPLLAALLNRQGMTVLVHGCETEDRRISTGAIWQALQWPVLTAPAALNARQSAWIQTRHLLPALERLLQLRRQMGLRNPGHSLVKLLDPLARTSDASTPRSASAGSLIVSSYTHPDYAQSMADTLALCGSSALLIRGTEGESIAAPQREPATLGVLRGKTCFVRTALRTPNESADSDESADQPERPSATSLTAEQTAQAIRDMLDGKLPVAEPIQQQVTQITALYQALAQPSAQSLARLQSFNRAQEAETS